MAKHPIIVEGPDGGGKTTLAKKLADAYGMAYTRPPEGVLSSSKGPQGGGALLEWWNDQLAKGPRHVVYDRCFFISDPIYQQAQVDRPLLSESSRLAQGIMRLWNLEPIIIFCLPPFEYQLANVKKSERDRLEGVGDKALEKISNQYWAYYAMWSNALFDNAILYDYTDPSSWEWVVNNLANLRMEVVREPS